MKSHVIAHAKRTHPVTPSGFVGLLVGSVPRADARGCHRSRPWRLQRCTPVHLIVSTLAGASDCPTMSLAPLAGGVWDGPGGLSGGGEATA